MRLIDRLHLDHPFAGSRMLRDLLYLRGIRVGRRHIGTLMRKIGIHALYAKPNTSARPPGHRIYPYLLRPMRIDRPNQVWAMDITYIPMARGLIYLAVVIRLVHPQTAVLKRIKHPGYRVLPGSGPGSHRPLGYTGDLQYRPGLSVHFCGLYRSDESQRYPHLPGRQGKLAGQCLHRTVVANHQIRGGLS